MKDGGDKISLPTEGKFSIPLDTFFNWLRLTLTGQLLRFAR
jgi:hypothetical protein